MVKCAVPSCKHDSRKYNKKNNDITFHRFPKDRELADKWVNAINRPNWEPNIRSSICSVHFNSASKSETTQGLRKLVSGAIPELHIPDPLDPLYGVPSYDESMVVDEGCTQDNEENIQSTQLNDQTLINVKKETPSISVKKESPSVAVKKESPSVTVKKESPSSSNFFVIKKDFLLEPSYTPREISLKRQIVHLRDIAKRRRSRCSALFNQVNRLKKKVSKLTELLTELRKKDLVKQEPTDVG